MMQQSNVTPHVFPTSARGWVRPDATPTAGLGINVQPKRKVDSMQAGQNVAAAPAGATGQLPAFGPSPLPDPEGARARLPQVRAAMATLSAHKDDDASVYAAYALMQRIAQLDLTTYGRLLAESQRTVTSASLQEAGHSLDQVLGQNKSTVLNAVGMGTFAVLTLTGVALGVSNNAPFLGQIASQATQIGQPMIGWVDRSSATVGGSYHANLASLAIKDDNIDQKSGSNMVEALRAAKEATQEAMRNCTELLNGHLARVADSLGKMTP